MTFQCNLPASEIEKYPDLQELMDSAALPNKSTSFVFRKLTVEIWQVSVFDDYFYFGRKSATNPNKYSTPVMSGAGETPLAALEEACFNYGIEELGEMLK